MRAPPASRRFAAQIRDALAARGQSVRAAERLAGMPQRSIQAVLEGHIPSLDRAAAIAAALGYELTIRPREPLSAPVPAPSGSRPRIRCLDPGPSPPAPEAPPEAAFERVADRHVAEILAAFADEYDAADGRAREALRIRFWHAYPDLSRKRERRLDRALAWLGWRVVAGREAGAGSASQSN